MANYDWFSKTTEDYRQEAEHLSNLARMQYTEEGYPEKTLVCLLCGSVVYGKLENKWATLHRTVCKKVTPGKHRKAV